MKLNTCLDNGWLVGADTEVPDDIRKYYSDKERFPIGCNRIYCSLCHSFVKNWKGFRITSGSYGQTEKTIKEIYETADPATSPHFTKDSDAWAYACKCWIDTIYADWSLGKSYTMIDDWACAGHPV